MEVILIFCEIKFGELDGWLFNSLGKVGRLCATGKE